MLVFSPIGGRTACPENKYLGLLWYMYIASNSGVLEWETFDLQCDLLQRGDGTNGTWTWTIADARQD